MTNEESEFLRVEAVTSSIFGRRPANASNFGLLKFLPCQGPSFSHVPSEVLALYEALSCWLLAASADTLRRCGSDRVNFVIHRRAVQFSFVSSS